MVRITNFSFHDVKLIQPTGRVAYIESTSEEGLMASVSNRFRVVNMSRKLCRIQGLDGTHDTLICFAHTAKTRYLLDYSRSHLP